MKGEFRGKVRVAVWVEFRGKVRLSMKGQFKGGSEGGKVGGV